MKYLLSLLLLGICAGCGVNRIEIENKADGGVYFLFRGEEHFVSAGGSITIGDIPNGTYPYSTTYVIPNWATSSEEAEGLAGALTFYRNQTEWTLLYASTGFDNVYSINCNISSNQPISVTGGDSENTVNAHR